MAKLKDSQMTKYNLKEIPSGARFVDLRTPEVVDAGLMTSPIWSVRSLPTPPAIGTKVKVTMNGLGTGTVTGYFVEHGWLGVHVKADNRPEWHKNAHPDVDEYLVFGVEIHPAD
jgi:hypothetical protein